MRGRKVCRLEAKSTKEQGVCAEEGSRFVAAVRACGLGASKSFMLVYAKA